MRGVDDQDLAGPAPAQLGPERLRPRNRTRGAAPVAPSSQATWWHSWLHSPVRVTSATTRHTDSIGAATVTSTRARTGDASRRGNHARSLRVTSQVRPPGSRSSRSITSANHVSYWIRGPAAQVGEQSIDLDVRHRPQPVALLVLVTVPPSDQRRALLVRSGGADAARPPAVAVEPPRGPTQRPPGVRSAAPAVRGRMPVTRRAAARALVPGRPAAESRELATLINGDTGSASPTTATSMAAISN